MIYVAEIKRSDGTWYPCSIFGSQDDALQWLTRLKPSALKTNRVTEYVAANANPLPQIDELFGIRQEWTAEPNPLWCQNCGNLIERGCNCQNRAEDEDCDGTCDMPILPTDHYSGQAQNPSEYCCMECEHWATLKLYAAKMTQLDLLGYSGKDLVESIKALEELHR